MLELSDKWLYSDCIDVPLDGSVDISIIVHDMFSIMVEHDGVGLAANQVGLPFKIICVDFDGLKTAVINPTITHMDGPITCPPERCLSYPGISVMMERFHKIRLEGSDVQGNPLLFHLKGMIARIVQHEYDHLHGKTITSK